MKCMKHERGHTCIHMYVYMYMFSMVYIISGLSSFIDVVCLSGLLIPRTTLVPASHMHALPYS